MNYDPKQMVKYIVWEATQNDIVLTWVRIIKFLYLADLYQARIDQGKTLSGWPWGFVHFGPYCTQAYEAVQEAVSLGMINKKTYDSHYEDRDEYDLFMCYDPDEPIIVKELHYYVVSELTHAIKSRGDDTANLLDHVYFETEPMRDALPSEPLDFSTASKPMIMPIFKMKKISSVSMEKSREALERLRNKHLLAEKKRKETEKQRLESGLYDDHYQKAMEYMDEEDLEPGLTGIAEIKT